jgi:hypothetical protein
VRALLWPLFNRSAWAQSAIVVAGTTGDCATQASFRSVGVGAASHIVGGHGWRERCSGLCSLGRRELSQPLWWLARKMMAQLWLLLDLSACDQPDTVVAGTKIAGAALATFLSVGLG